MAKVAIVTDSTAYIPAAEVQGLPITTIPLNLIWANETYQDGVDIQPAEFYYPPQGCQGNALHLPAITGCL